MKEPTTTESPTPESTPESTTTPKSYPRNIFKTAFIAAIIDDLLMVLALFFFQIVSKAVLGYSSLPFDPFSLSCMFSYAWLIFMPATLLTTWIFRALKLSVRFELLVATTLGILTSCIIPFLFSAYG